MEVSLVVDKSDVLSWRLTGSAEEAAGGSGHNDVGSLFENELQFALSLAGVVLKGVER